MGLEQPEAELFGALCYGWSLTRLKGVGVVGWFVAFSALFVMANWRWARRAGCNRFIASSALSVVATQRQADRGGHRVLR